MKAWRTEKDSLGEVLIPGDVLWGAQTERARQNFAISGQVCDPALIRAYLRIKRAAATANRKTQALSQNTAHLLIDAIDELYALQDSELIKSFPLDHFQAGAGTSLHMNINEVIANWANRKKGFALGSYHPIHPNDHVNRSQSTNDTFPAAMRLALLEVSAPLIQSSHELAQAFYEKARAWQKIPKAARTHLQDAVPLSLGEEFRAYGAAIETAAHWLEQACDSLRVLGLGGSAAGTQLTVPRGYIPLIIDELARSCNQRLVAAPNLYEAMQSQAAIGRFTAHLRGLAIELSRICNDLRLLASGPLTGLCEILLPAVQPGSSIMPGKLNPSILEMVNQVCFTVIGNDHAVALAVQAGQLELNVMMPQMANSALEATRILETAQTTLTRLCIRGMEPNLERLQHYVESTPQLATALSPLLGYEKVAALVQESLRSKISVIELVRRQNLLSEKALNKILQLDSLLGI